MKTILYFFLFIVPITQALAEGTYITYGVGNYSCGKFVKEQNVSASDTSFYSIWLTGYLTRYARDNKVDSISTDIYGMELWVLNYCKENPTMNLAYASAILLRYLEENNQVKHYK